MGNIKSLSISKRNDYLIEQLKDKVPIGTGFTDSIMMAVEAFVKTASQPIPDVLEDIEIWKDRILTMPPEDLDAINSRAVQLVNLTEWEKVGR